MIGLVRTTRINRSYRLILFGLIVIAVSCFHEHRHAYREMENQSYGLEVTLIRECESSDRKETTRVLFRNRGKDEFIVNRIDVVDTLGDPVTYASPIFKFSTKQVKSFGMAYAFSTTVLKSGQSFGGVRVELESGRRKFWMIVADDAKQPSVKLQFSSDNHTVQVSIFSAVDFELKKSCFINGNEADCGAVATFKTAFNNYAKILEVRCRKPYRTGVETVVELEHADGTKIFGVGKAIPMFVCCKTHFDLVVRPISIKQTEYGVRVAFYNEADFRKSPAQIVKVFVDDNDVTGRCVSLDQILPPDRHNYERDILEVDIPMRFESDAQIKRVVIEFRRLAPAERGPIPKNYFDLQSVSFDVRNGLIHPIESDPQFGLLGGICLHHDGLRPQPSDFELRSRRSSVLSVASTIPTFAFLRDGASRTDLASMEGICDFLVIGQPSLESLSPENITSAKAFRSMHFPESFENLGLSIPWACSCLLDSMDSVRQEDIEWMTWTAIGIGSKGIALSVSDSIEISQLSAAQAYCENVRADVRKLQGLIELGVPIVLRSKCNQTGIRSYLLGTGPDDLLLIVVNDWTTRAESRETLPSCFAARCDVVLDIEHGSDWIPRNAYAPISGKPVLIERLQNGTSRIAVPTFRSVEIIQLSRKTDMVSGATDTNLYCDQSISLACSPVITLGYIPPKSLHRIAVPLQSHSGDKVTIRTPQMQNCSSAELMLYPGEKGTFEIEFQAPLATGQFTTSVPIIHDGGEMAVVIMADVEEAVSLMPSLIDFGGNPNGDVSQFTKKIELKSRDEFARVVRVSPRSDLIEVTNIAPDGQSFNVVLTTSENTGLRVMEIDVDVKISSGEIFPLLVRAKADLIPIVSSNPSRIVTILPSGPRNFTLSIQHFAKELIRIESISPIPGIKSSFNQQKYDTRHTVQIEVVDDSAIQPDSIVIIRGLIKTGAMFEIEVPVVLSSYLPVGPIRGQR